MTEPFRPTREQIAASAGKTLPDVSAPGLRVLFVGINPGLYTAAIRKHFGRPGNRFWPALHLGGFTPRLYSPFEERLLLDLGLGITNLVARASARAEELTDEEMVAGAARLTRKIRRLQPRFAAFLGVTAYRTGFGRPQARLGRQEEKIGDTTLWVLPSPSGLNAHHTLPALGKLFAELKEAVDGHAPRLPLPPR